MEPILTEYMGNIGYLAEAVTRVADCLRLEIEGFEIDGYLEQIEDSVIAWGWDDPEVVAIRKLVGALRERSEPVKEWTGRVPCLCDQRLDHCPTTEEANRASCPWPAEYVADNRPLCASCVATCWDDEYEPLPAIVYDQYRNCLYCGTTVNDRGQCPECQPRLVAVSASADDNIPSAAVADAELNAGR